MADPAIKLAEALVPGVGTPLYALHVAQQIWSNIQETRLLCKSVHVRLEKVWRKLEAMEEANAMPPKFNLTEFTDIVARFHTLVLKQTTKSLIVRVGTAATFVTKLRRCHEDIDHMCEMLQLEVEKSLMEWRGEWEHNVDIMTEKITQIAATNAAIRVELGGIRESVEALTMLVHEQQRQRDQQRIVESLQAICYQLAREHKITLPESVPAWFSTFDDIDFERKPLYKPSETAMGTVHRGTWGGTTPVIVKRVELPPPKKSGPVRWKEADVWWQLNHPNILRLFGACHVTQPAFMVCEKAKYGNIREYLAPKSGRTHRFWRLQVDVASALVYLREKHVVHGNLKCTNILISEDGQAKISDFACSRIQNDSNGADGVAATNTISLAPCVPSWPAPELRAAAESGEQMVPTYESDVYAFAVCILELLSEEQPWGDEQFLAKETLNPRRPSGVTDEMWDVIKRMCCQKPEQRLTIHQVLKRLQRIAKGEAATGECSSTISSCRHSEGVSPKRDDYKHSQHDAPQQHQYQGQKDQLQRELEDLRRKIRHEERLLEHVMEQRQQAENAEGESKREARAISLPSSLSTKQVLRLLRWGTTEEQTEALKLLDSNQVEHSALEIVRNNGLDVLIASMKHGHSSEFRSMAIDVLQSITTAGTGLYLDAVLEHGVTQILMSILHYRRIPVEQRRAAQFLVLLSSRSARARSFFQHNAGVDLLIKLLWQEQIPMFDKHFKSRCDSSIVAEMRQFLASQGEPRAREGQRAMEKGNRDLAMQKYTEAIVLDPRNGRLYAKRSEVYAAFRKYDHAKKDALQCIKFLPHYGEGYYRQAIALFGLKLPAQADGAVREGVKYDRHFFTPDRLNDLKMYAPRDRYRDNDDAWKVKSMEF